MNTPTDAQLHQDQNGSTLNRHDLGATLVGGRVAVGVGTLAAAVNDIGSDRAVNTGFAVAGGMVVGTVVGAILAGIGDSRAAARQLTT